MAFFNEHSTAYFALKILLEASRGSCSSRARSKSGLIEIRPLFEDEASSSWHISSNFFYPGQSGDVGDSDPWANNLITNNTVIVLPLRRENRGAAWICVRIQIRSVRSTRCSDSEIQLESVSNS